jgi:hypothetical protein
MTRKILIPLVILGLSLSALFSCSSGGGIGGTGAAGVTVGPISGFGSIVVNDVHFDISDATVTVQGAAGDPNDPNLGLKLGMVVVVRGEFSGDGLTGVATSVDFEDNLEGPVESVDVPGNQFTVLQHTVIVNTSTVFDGLAAFGDLVKGNMVEVSGPVDATGAIVASRVEKKGETFAEVGELEIKGFVSSLDDVAKTFNLGSLQVNYSAVQADDLPDGGLTDGLYVEVKSTQAPSGGTIAASEIELQEPFTDSLGSEGDHVEVEGFVTDFSSIDQPFRVNGVPVQATTATQYEHGLPGGVANGVRLEVEGDLDADGVLVADKVEFEDGGDEAEGP